MRYISFAKSPDRGAGEYLRAKGIFQRGQGGNHPKERQRTAEQAADRDKAKTEAEQKKDRLPSPKKRCRAKIGCKDASGIKTSSL